MNLPLLTPYFALRRLLGRILPLLFCIIFSQSIAQSDAFKPLEFSPLESGQWVNRATFTEFAVLPWNQDGGLKAEKQPDAQGAAVKPLQLQWPEVKVEALLDGRLLVVGAKEILVLDKNGKVEGQFPVPIAEVADMALTPAGELVYLGSTINEFHVLGKLDQGGKHVWKHQEGQFRTGKLLWVQGQLAFSKTIGNTTLVLPVDLETGLVGEKMMGFPSFAIAFSGREGEICFLEFDTLTYKPAKWNRIKPGAEPRVVEVPADLRSVLFYSIESDANSNCYGAMNYEMGMLNADGGSGFLIGMEACFPGADGEMFLSRWDEGAGILKVMRKTMKEPAEILEITIPDWISASHNRPIWRLSAIEGGKYVLVGRDPQSFVWHRLVVFPQTGTIVVQPPAKGKSLIGTQLQPEWTWRAMRDGSIIFPVQGAEALHLVRMVWNSEE